MGLISLDAPPAIALRAIVTLIAMMAGGGLLVVALRLLRRRPKAEPGAPRPASESLAKRYLTLMALVVLVLAPAFLGGFVFVASIVAIAALGVRELRGVIHPESPRVPMLVTAIAIVIATAIGGIAWVGPVIGLGFVLIAAWTLAQGTDRLPERVGGALLAAVYVGAMCAFMVALRRGPSGFGRYLYFLAVVQVADLGGLFGGMAFGRRKLAPSLSPGKTWEGTIASLVAAAAGGALFAFAMPEIRTWTSAALAVPLAVTGLLGDLFASGLKRSAGLKDFGALLPGHGGILDRFDSYLVSAPFAWGAFTLVDMVS